MANVITIVRITCSILMIIFKPLSIWFNILYCMSGISDMLDGYVARKTNTTSEFGSKLDSIADIIFITVCLFKILPCVNINLWLLIWMILIIVIRIINILYGFFVKNKIIMLHTLLNKLTGLLLFVFPLIIHLIPIIYYEIVICIFATVAALQEFYLIKTKGDINEY